MAGEATVAGEATARQRRGDGDWISTNVLGLVFGLSPSRRRTHRACSSSARSPSRRCRRRSCCSLVAVVTDRPTILFALDALCYIDGRPCTDRSVVVVTTARGDGCGKENEYSYLFDLGFLCVLLDVVCRKKIDSQQQGRSDCLR